MELESTGRVLLVAGFVLLIVGGIVLLLGRVGLDALPGNLRFESGNLACFTPLGLSCLISIVGTIVLNVLIWLANR